MRLKIIISIIILLSGLSLFGMANYITKQVAIGRGEVAEWQVQVNRANRIIDKSTEIQGLGNAITTPAQEKLNAGTKKANYYANLATRLKIGGIALILIAVLFLFLIFVKYKKIRPL